MPRKSPFLDPKSNPACRVVLLWHISLASLSAYAADEYEIVDIGSLTGESGFSQAFRLNNLGQVVGESEVDGITRSFFWDNGVMRDLGLLPGAVSTYARDLNDLGQVVGGSGTREMATPFLLKPFIWQNGVIQLLPGLPGADYCEATGINNGGQIVGNCFFGTEPPGPFEIRVFLIEGSSTTTLPKFIDGENWIARDINDSGQIVGEIFFNTGESETVIFYDNGTFTDLGKLPNTVGLSVARALNNAGHVVGSSRISEGRRAALFKPDGNISLGVLPGPSVDPHFESAAFNLNDHDQIVGESFPTLMVGYNAFIWDAQNGMRLLHDLVVDSDPLKSQMRFQEGFDINNAGQVIIANGLFNDGRTHGILLNPISTPANSEQIPTFKLPAALLLGAFLILLARRLFKVQ